MNITSKMSSNSKIVCECGSEMLKKSYNRHLLTNKHNELMKLKNNKKTLDNYFKDNHQDNKPIIAEPVNTPITAEKVNLIESITPIDNITPIESITPIEKDLNNEQIEERACSLCENDKPLSGLSSLENKTIQNEPIIVIPKKFTKSDYIDMLLYHLNKDNHDPNKRVTLTNLSKAKIDKIKEAVIKYEITDEKQTYYDMMKIKLIKKEEEREREEEEREWKEKLRLRELQDLKDKGDYDNLPEYVKRLCEKKLEYEKYTDELKYQLNTIKCKNELMQALKNEGMNCTDTKSDVIHLNGVNVNIIGSLKE